MATSMELVLMINCTLHNYLFENLHSNIIITNFVNAIRNLHDHKFSTAPELCQLYQLRRGELLNDRKCNNKSTTENIKNNIETFLQYVNFNQTTNPEIMKAVLCLIDGKYKTVTDLNSDLFAQIKILTDKNSELIDAYTDKISILMEENKILSSKNAELIAQNKTATNNTTAVFPKCHCGATLPTYCRRCTENADY